MSEKVAKLTKAIRESNGDFYAGLQKSGTTGTDYTSAELEAAAAGAAPVVDPVEALLLQSFDAETDADADRLLMAAYEAARPAAVGALKPGSRVQLRQSVPWTAVNDVFTNGHIGEIISMESPTHMGTSCVVKWDKGGSDIVAADDLEPARGDA